MNKEERLREYINKDYSYINYKTGVEEGTDFDKFCIQHCKDIEELLEENQKLKADLQLQRGALKSEHEARHRSNDIEEIIDKIKIELKQGITFCKNDSQGLYDKCNIAINREQIMLDILKEVE